MSASSRARRGRSIRRRSPMIIPPFSPILPDRPAGRREWCRPIRASSGGSGVCRNTGPARPRIGRARDGREASQGSCGVGWPEGGIELVGADGTANESYGELWVRNPGVTPGYHGLPEVNRQRIVDGWLKTGDLFSCDAGGFYYFRGRTDDMFNCGGENVYPLEVENLLLKHPAIADVSVVPVPHKIKGEAPVAMVVLANGKGADEAALKSFYLSGGPAYAHPRRVFFVDGLPLNGAGKTDRKIVQKQVLAMLGEAGLGGA